MEYFRQIEKALEDNNSPKLSSLWEEYCYSDTIDVSEAVLILRAINNSALKSSFGIYVDTILPLWNTLEESKEKEEILRLVFDIETHNDKALYDTGIQYIENKYGKEQSFSQYCKLSGILDSSNFQGTMSNFLLLNHMKEGAFVHHASGWGVGEVLDFSIIREEVSVDFEFASEVKDLSLQNAFKTLDRIDDSHFLVKRFGFPDDLEEEAKKTPVDVIKQLLRDLGPKTALDIKHEMMDSVIPEQEWIKWWQSARTKLKKDPLIGSPSSAKKPFVLRSEKLSLSDRYTQLVAKAKNTDEIVYATYSFLRDFPTCVKDAGCKEAIDRQCCTLLEEGDVTEYQKLELLYIKVDIQTASQDEVDTVIKETTQPASIVNALPIIGYKKRFLSDLIRLQEQWYIVFLYAFKEVDHAPLREYILTTLIEHGFTTQLEETIASLEANPARFPSASFWYFTRLMNKGGIVFDTPEGKAKLLESFFTLLHKIESDTSQRDLTKKMISFLEEGRFVHVREIFSKAMQSNVEEILLLSTKCSSLSQSTIQTLHSLALVVHPNLKGQANYTQKEVELEPIWTTKGGLEALKDKIEHIGTVETVENAKEIEVARSHGDLRENSEFKFALEKRDRLQAEIGRLSNQLQRMRILTPADVDTSMVVPGTTVVLQGNRDHSTKTTQFTILGPMEADPDNGILSYKSKLAESLLNKKVGDLVSIHSNEYVVDSILLAKL